MTNTAQNESRQHSRLGRLLVNKGYISEGELQKALLEQSYSGARLGEILVAQGSLSDQDLRRTLRRQSFMRKAATMVTIFCAPLQPLTALAATAASPLAVPNIRPSLNRAEFSGVEGMQLMSDSELDAVNAQGFIGAPALTLGQQNFDMAGAGLIQKYNDDDDEDQQDDEQIAAELADTVLTFAGLGPVSGLLDANITIEGLRYAEGRQMLEITDDGGMKFYMPESIDRISMEDMRVKGSDDAATFGSIYMSDITFGAGSSYTIRARESNIH